MESKVRKGNKRLNRQVGKLLSAERTTTTMGRSSWSRTNRCSCLALPLALSLSFLWEPSVVSGWRTANDDPILKSQKCKRETVTRGGEGVEGRGTDVFSISLHRFKSPK